MIRCSTPKSISNADAGIVTVPALPFSELLLIDDDTARRDASGLSVHMYVWYESTDIHFGSDEEDDVSLDDDVGVVE